MNLLYPNPAARFLYDQSEKDLEDLYVFAGRLLGKALFENVTLQPQFAHFFLAFMNGNYNFINLIDDLATLDAELYKNLIFLKSYEVDASVHHCRMNVQHTYSTYTVFDMFLL
jgi:ubiquitin-protein ligase E3 C